NILHLRILDSNQNPYQVPHSIFNRPKNQNLTFSSSKLTFSFEESPFSFTILRSNNLEILFSTKFNPIIYKKNHIQIKTILPSNPNIFGLGQTIGPFRLNTNGNGTIRTLWARDAYGTPIGSNTYGSHPIYLDHRPNATHGVFLLNSNGMDITLKDHSLQYDILGGILDFYFLAGPSPIQVAQQYASIAGLPAMIPYWSLGFQQSRYGYTDYLQIAQVITNYSNAEIPLETMWTDIDYMYKRQTFTLDQQYFPLKRMQEIVNYLHTHHQRYVMMVDPAVAYQPGDQGAFDRGKKLDVFLKEKDASIYKGLVWPGLTAYPDWFHPNAESYWINEISQFFHINQGIDIDGIWIDMNEPTNFALPCGYPCTNKTLLPENQALISHNPPNRTTLPPPNNTTLPWPKSRKRRLRRDIIQDFDNYQINNGAGKLDIGTVRTDIVHFNGLTMYDTHNLYGTHMSLITRKAMINRKPKIRPQIITRSTFAGAGTYAGLWTGDNLSDWPHYLYSISEIMSFAAIFQIPFVGADVCGFGKNTTEELCARWASLGAFYPFYRNHNELGSISQEFYRWQSVARSAKNAIKIRYSLLDYFYSHLQRQSMTGEPAIKPLWFLYPQDQNTFSIDTQFFFGDSVLISPVLGPDSTSINPYFPQAGFVDFITREIVNKKLGHVELHNIAIDQISVHVKPGSILPLRQVQLDQTDKIAYTTSQVRKRNFEILIVLDTQLSANGFLYLDDGESLEPLIEETAQMEFSFNKNLLTISGRMGNSLDDIHKLVYRLSITGLPNLNELKEVRILTNKTESGFQLLHLKKDSKTQSVWADGLWELSPGQKVMLIYQDEKEIFDTFSINTLFRK
ncbi:hypothetical protein O181_077729, partial [Austropuccinia psidii MF-1]|nr:hypothetical protein [Austropuccinia psidii MF-1]